MEVIGQKITIGGKERVIALDLNALIVYARITGSEVAAGLKVLESAGINLEEKFTAIRHLLYAALTSHEKWKPENLADDLFMVGNWLQPSNMMRVMEAIMDQANEANGSAAEFEGQLAPFVPSSPAVVEAAIRLAGLKEHDVFLDLGAGDGRLLIAAAEANETVKAIGYEAHLERYRGIKALVKERKLGNRIVVHNEEILSPSSTAGDAIGEATVIYMYLLQGTTNHLFRTFADRFKPGTKVITQDFTIDSLRPVQTVSVTVAEGATHVLSSYIIEEPESKEPEAQQKEEPIVG